MNIQSLLTRSLHCLVGSFLLFAAPGCTYLKYRGQDAMDFMDVGVTFSAKPQFSFYASGPFVQIGALGIGKVDGHFFGLGDGQACLWAPHYEASVGVLVWGEEWISYRSTEASLAALPLAEAELTGNFMRVAPIGFIQGPTPSLKYFGSCPHYLHVGWIGLVGSPRWLQMADFVLGFTTLDLCQDDGPKRDVPGGCQIWRGGDGAATKPLILPSADAAAAAPKAEAAPKADTPPPAK